MKTKILKTSFLALTIGLFMSSCDKDEDTTPSDSSVIIEEAFKKDASGWTIIGDAQGGFVAASYSPEGGVTDGYIFAEDDVIGGVWYFNAPQPYLGQKDNYYGATLNFSLYQESSRSRQFEFEDIVFKSGDLQLFYKHESPSNFPKNEWTNYSIKISASTAGWYVGNYKDTYDGPEQDYSVATEQEMKDILSNLTEFWIRGEFEVGTDTGGLDNVKISK